MQDRTKKIIRWSLIAVCVILLVICCIKWLIPLSKLLVTEEGRTAICDKVRSFGILAPVIYILLMALQIVIAFIPGGPMELIGGMLFGSWVGILCCVSGAFLGTLFVFLLVRKFGKPIVDIFVPEEKAAKLKFLQNEEKLESIVFILFLIPGIPKDLLTYLVPLTRMRGRDFVILSTLARFPSLAASVVVGDSLSNGNYWLTAIICTVAAILTFIGYMVKNRITKEKSE